MIKEIIREEYKQYPSRILKVFIIKCLGSCGNEISIPKSKLKTATGYCYKCYLNKDRKTKFISDFRLCIKCNKELPVNKFVNQNKGFINNICSKCHSLKRYGINSLDFDKLFEEQNGVCYICKKLDNHQRLSVDHCHETNEVRGLLCSTCNHGLGNFKDNIEYLQTAILYLEKFKKKIFRIT